MDKLVVAVILLVASTTGVPIPQSVESSDKEVQTTEVPMTQMNPMESSGSLGMPMANEAEMGNPGQQAMCMTPMNQMETSQSPMNQMENSPSQGMPTQMMTQDNSLPMVAVPCGQTVPMEDSFTQTMPVQMNPSEGSGMQMQNDGVPKQETPSPNQPNQQMMVPQDAQNTTPDQQQMMAVQANEMSNPQTITMSNPQSIQMPEISEFPKMPGEPESNTSSDQQMMPMPMDDSQNQMMEQMQKSMVEQAAQQPQQMSETPVAVPQEMKMASDCPVQDGVMDGNKISANCPTDESVPATPVEKFTVVCEGDDCAQDSFSLAQAAAASDGSSVVPPVLSDAQTTS